MGYGRWIGRAELAVEVGERDDGDGEKKIMEKERKTTVVIEVG